MEIARKKMAQYKQIREVVQKGTLYRLQSPFESQRCSLQYVTADKTKSVVFMYNLWDTLKLSTPTMKNYQNVRLKGLDTDATYTISNFWGRSASDKMLINIRLPSVAYSDTNSKIFILEKK